MATAIFQPDGPFSILGGTLTRAVQWGMMYENIVSTWEGGRAQEPSAELRQDPSSGPPRNTDRSSPLPIDPVTIRKRISCVQNTCGLNFDVLILGAAAKMSYRRDEL